MIQKKLAYIPFLLALSSCDLTESHKQIRNEMDEIRNRQNELDSLEKKFDRLREKIDLDSVPEYIIDDENRLIEK